MLSWVRKLRRKWSYWRYTRRIRVRDLESLKVKNSLGQMGEIHPPDRGILYIWADKLTGKVGGYYHDDFR
jgi:hypothetical protein